MLFLVAATSEDLRVAMTTFFEDRGVAVDSVADGTTACIMASRKHYDVVVTDQFMPRMGGLELGKRLREVNGLGTKIVLQSGVAYRLSSDDTAVFDFVMAKPYRPEDLVIELKQKGLKMPEVR